MTLKVLIVDDEPPARRRLALMLDQLPNVVVAGQVADGHEALRCIRTAPPDVVLLDIKMPAMDGFEFLTELDVPDPPIVIFVTAFMQHALRAWQHEAAGYLLKPVPFDELSQAMRRAEAALRARKAEGRAEELLQLVEALREAPHDPPRYEAEFWVSTRGRQLRVPISSVDRIEAERDYVRIFAGDTSYLMRGSIGSLVARLDPELFLRIHRSAIIAMKTVIAVEKGVHGGLFVLLAGGKRQQVGRTYERALRSLYRAANKPSAPAVEKRLAQRRP